MKALAVMPFSKDFDDVFRSMDRACESCVARPTGVCDKEADESLAQLICERIDQRLGASFDIVKELLESIKTCAFCLADLTGGNQNVLWEVGFAMALEKPVILLTQKREDVAFDLRGMKVIEYDRKNLDTSLEERLVGEINVIVANMTDVPVLSLHAKALAMSSGSPTYFLDSNYRIHYMNEAAANLFTTTMYGRSKSWIGSNLRDFINDISGKLENLPDIEKNLQVQTEEIRHLEAAGNSSAIPTYNIEPIILNSPAYGKLSLQKTGIAVRDPSTGQVTGWVVSFNVVKAHDPMRYERFHEKHKIQIEGLLFRREKTNSVGGNGIYQSPDIKPEWPDSTRIADWVKNGCESPRLTIADNYAQKQRCFDFCASVMTGDKRRYGLESVEHLDDWFFDYSSAEYILLRTPGNDLVGVGRIHMDRDPDFTRYKGLEAWVTQAAKDGQSFADVGAYLHPLIKGKWRTTCLAKMLGRAARIGERNYQVHLYAQVPSYLARLFNEFLFRRAGETFKCPGWRQPSWTPIVLKCIVYSGGGETAEWPKPEKVDNEFIDNAREEYLNEVKNEWVV